MSKKKTKEFDYNGSCKALSQGKIKGKHKWIILDSYRKEIDEFNKIEYFTEYCNYCNELYSSFKTYNYGLIDALEKNQIEFEHIEIDLEDKE